MNISDIYEESKKIAEKKIKEELKEYEIEEIEKDEDLDLSIDEFEEEEEEIPLKFEKRKAGKDALEGGEDFTNVECPFCGELFDDLESHIQNCEFAPDDASIEDVIPSKPKKKKKRKVTTAEKKKEQTNELGTQDDSQEKKTCPYCGKEFLRLGRHLNSCKKKPKDTKEESE